MTRFSDHPERRQDVIAGSILLLFAIGWTIAVWLTVPTGYGVGPRAFPLWLGVALAVLSALLLLKGLFGPYGATAPDPEGDEGPSVSMGRRLWLVAVVCGLIVAFGWLMPKIGFILATMVTVAVALAGPLGERRPLLVGGMAVGIALGAWLAFGKILGAYMPSGAWISFF
jgi:hypothetical protein